MSEIGITVSTPETILTIENSGCLVQEHPDNVILNVLIGQDISLHPFVFGPGPAVTTFLALGFDKLGVAGT